MDKQINQNNPEHSYWTWSHL